MCMLWLHLGMRRSRSASRLHGQCICPLRSLMLRACIALIRSLDKPGPKWILSGLNCGCVRFAAAPVLWQQQAITSSAANVAHSKSSFSVFHTHHASPSQLYKTLARYIHRSHTHLFSSYLTISSYMTLDPKTSIGAECFSAVSKAPQ